MPNPGIKNERLDPWWFLWMLSGTLMIHTGASVGNGKCVAGKLRKALPSVPASYNVIKVARERFRMVCSERSVSRSAWFLPSANFPELFKSLKFALNETMATRKARQTFSLETFTDSLNYSLRDHQRQFTGNKNWLPPRSIWITHDHSISILLVLSCGVTQVQASTGRELLQLIFVTIVPSYWSKKSAL